MSHGQPAGATGERFLRAVRDRGMPMPETCEVLTGRSFVAVRVPDGSIGTAMDYSGYGQSQAEGAPAYRRCPTAQVLEGAADSSGPAALRAAAEFVALLGALSRPCYLAAELRADGLMSAQCSYAQQRRHPLGGISREILIRSLDGAASVGVVGFGGFMEMYAELDSVRQILVCDRDLRWRAERAAGTVQRLNQAYGSIKISLAGDKLERLRDECDVVQITASALCNGSMDELLDTLAGKPLVVVGPSGALIPAEWKAAGAIVLCTELRQPDFWWAYQFDDHLYEWFTEYDDRIYIW